MKARLLGLTPAIVIGALAIALATPAPAQLFVYGELRSGWRR